MSEKFVTPGERETTVNVNGDCAVTFAGKWPVFAVRNDSDGEMHISVESGRSPGDDGVVPIPSGQVFIYAHHLAGGRSTVYISGSGRAVVIAQHDSVNPFMVGAKGGDTPTPPVTADYIQDGLIAEWELDRGLVEKVSGEVFDSSQNPQSLWYDEDIERHVGYIQRDRYAVVSADDVFGEDFVFGSFSLQALVRIPRNNSTYQMCFGITLTDSVPYEYDSSCILSAYDRGQLIAIFGGNQVDTSKYITDNAWHQIGCTYDNGIITTYCDGELLSTETRTLRLSYTKLIRFGNWINPALNPVFGSYLANCCIYSRALTAAEIAANWAVDVQRYGLGGQNE